VQPLAFKMLFRKKGTASAILAIALLVALTTSVNSLVNNINSQTSVLSELPSIGQTYLITSKNSTSLSDSQIDPALINQIKNNSNVNYAASQQIIQATLTTKLGNYTVNILGVDNVRAYFDNDGASISGSVSQNQSETDVGIILANLASININSSLTVTIYNKITQLNVVGISRTTKQSDTELIMPLKNLQALTKNNHTISFIEFSIKDFSTDNKTIASITQTLPSDVKITKVQQIQTFAQDINNQTINFINVWSIAVYIVITAASYIITTRMINEAKYDLYMLRALGAKKKTTISLIILHTLIIGFISSIIGVAIGIVGTQIAATGVRWLWSSFAIAPFLQPSQALEILSLALASCLTGCIYPAMKTAQKLATENPE